MMRAMLHSFSHNFDNNSSFRLIIFCNSSVSGNISYHHNTSIPSTRNNLPERISGTCQFILLDEQKPPPSPVHNPSCPVY